jgi:leucyl/phenylalanyl-tRNA--protein transferase
MLYLLDDTPAHQPFPDPARAERQPNGLLAVGGDLRVERLVNAYRQGVFPWYSAGQPILWWSPDPRLILPPAAIHIARSLRKTLRQGRLRITLDQDFEAVIRACAEPRGGDDGTWLVEDMILAYLRLHRRNLAHSVEVWEEGCLVGGLYGVALGRVFCGESMFSRRPDASKVALVCLARRLQAWGYPAIDCQMHTGHLERLGAREIPRARWQALLARWTRVPGQPGHWQAHAPAHTAELLAPPPEPPEDTPAAGSGSRV